MNTVTWGDFEVDLDRVIGRGGTSMVYFARQRSLDRPCVVKVLDLETRTPEERRELLARFQNEAKMIARVRDPRIVQVFQAGENEGRFWIAMELVNGRTLEEHLQAGRLFEPGEVARIGLEIARALKAAFDQEHMIHRDVKPANVFLLESGDVKISDFGLAKVVGTQNSKLTRTGYIMGTPSYLAPEVIRGETVDHRSDIYALGCVMYELACQLPPFDGENYVELFFKHVHEPPTPPRELKPELPPALEAIILKCLNKEAAHRYATYEELIADLQTLLLRPAAPPPRHIPWRWLLLSAAALLGLGFALLIKPSSGALPDATTPATPEPPKPNLQELHERACRLLAKDRLSREDLRQALADLSQAIEIEGARRKRAEAHFLNADFKAALSDLQKEDDPLLGAMIALWTRDYARRDWPEPLRELAQATVSLATAAPVRDVQTFWDLARAYKTLSDALWKVQRNRGMDLVACVGYFELGRAYARLDEPERAGLLFARAVSLAARSEALADAIKSEAMNPVAPEIDAASLIREVLEDLERGSEQKVERLLQAQNLVDLKALQAEQERLGRERAALVKLKDRIVEVLEHYPGTIAFNKALRQIRDDFDSREAPAGEQYWQPHSMADDQVDCQVDAFPMRLRSDTEAWLFFENAGARKGYDVQIAGDVPPGAFAALQLEELADDQRLFVRVRDGFAEVVRRKDKGVFETIGARHPFKPDPERAFTFRVRPFQDRVAVFLDDTLLAFERLPLSDAIKIGVGRTEIRILSVRLRK